MTITRETLHYAKRGTHYIWETESGYHGAMPMDGDTILIDGQVYEIGEDRGDGAGAPLVALGAVDEYDFDFDIANLDGVVEAK